MRVQSAVYLSDLGSDRHGYETLILSFPSHTQTLTARQNFLQLYSAFIQYATTTTETADTRRQCLGEWWHALGYSEPPDALPPSELSSSCFLSAFASNMICHLGRKGGHFKPAISHLSQQAALYGADMLHCGMKRVIRL